jgi:tetratricopeptide (TPR) repeat protein
MKKSEKLNKLFERIQEDAPMTEKRVNPNSTTKEIDDLTLAIEAATDSVNLMELYLKRAHCYGEIQNDSSSVEDLLNALDHTISDTDISRIRSMIALLFAKKNDRREQALYWAVGAVDSDSESAEAHYVLGLVSDCCDYVQVAIESLKRAIELNPDHLDAHRLLGLCYRKSLRLKEAINALSAYLEKLPQDPVALFELANAFKLSTSTVVNTQRAIELYQKALEMNPDSNLKAMIEKKLESISRVL